MVKFEQGKVKMEISYGMLVSLGVIGVGLWYILRDETKPRQGLLGFLRKPGPGQQAQGAQGQTHTNRAGIRPGPNVKRPAPPPPVPRSAEVDTGNGGNGNDSFGGQSQGGSQARRW